jgi:3-methyladenine DNA glycosylase/8-oxoguanine DNA glycosylase
MPDFARTLGAAERHLKKVDATLAPHIARVGPCQLERAQQFKPFDALLNSIVHQQLNGTAAQTIVGRVRTRFADGKWPTPQVMAKARMPSLRACGLSTAKALAIRDLAHKTLDGTVPTARVLHGLPDEAIIERLTQVRGIGPWTVQMMLMFRLGRLDVLPVDDYGVRKGFTQLYGHGELVGKQALATHAEAWRPYRAVASWYLWRVLDV